MSYIFMFIFFCILLCERVLTEIVKTPTSEIYGTLTFKQLLSVIYADFVYINRQ